MRSRRSRFETGCRIGAFALLGWLVGGSLIPSRGRRVERASSSDLAEKLNAWTWTTPNVSLHATLATTPDAWAVDWLAALAHSGRVVTWSGSPPALVMSVEPIVDPNRGARVDVAAPNGTTIALRDDASPIDSLRVASLGGSVLTPIAAGTVRGDAGGQRVASPAADSSPVRAVMVVGAAGWEGKYVVSALEERGWPVIARFTVAPNVDVTQGSTAALDTSRVSAVVAIDSTVQTLGASLERFVRAGGGLVLAGPSGASRAVATLAPGSLGARTRPNVKATDTVRLGSTGFYPISSLHDDGVALERRPEGVVVAARRIGAGRVIEVGYDDSWRWRMAGAAGSEKAHREWWSRVVASVAYAPATPTHASPADAAPVAHLVGRLGPARAVPAGAPHRPVDRRVIITLIMILLLTEWASRRLRGLR